MKNRLHEASLICQRTAFTYVHKKWRCKEAGMLWCPITVWGFWMVQGTEYLILPCLFEVYLAAGGI